MSDEPNTVVGIAAAIVAGATYGLSKMGLIPGGKVAATCPDQECRKKIQDHSLQLVAGSKDFEWIKKELQEVKDIAAGTRDAVSELSGYLQGREV